MLLALSPNINPGERARVSDPSFVVNSLVQDGGRELPPSRAGNVSGALALNDDAVEGCVAPSQGARVLQEGVVVDTSDERVRGQEPEWADVGELLKEGVVAVNGGHLQNVRARASPRLQLLGESVPSVPVARGERGGEHVVEVHLGDGAVPVGAVMELDALAEVEGVLFLGASSDVGDAPRLGERGQDRASSAVLDKALSEMLAIDRAL